MDSHRSRSSQIAAVLLAAALTSGGILTALLPPLLVSVILQRIAGLGAKLDGYGSIAGALVAAFLGGAVLAWLGSFYRGWRWIAAILLIARLAVSATLFLFLAEIDELTIDELWLTLGVEAVALLLLTMSQILFPFWLGRLAGRDGANPFFLLAFIFLGYTIGALAYPLAIDFNLSLEQKWFWINAGFALPGLLYFSVFCLFLTMPATETAEVASPPAPTWLRRLRWLLLGGIPGCVMFSMTSYFCTEIAPIPLLWLLVLAFYLISWVVAFARMTGDKEKAFGWVVQILAGAPFLLILWFLRNEVPGAEFVWMVAFLIALVGVFFVPQRFSLAVQSVLLAVVLLLMFVDNPFAMNIAWTLFAHLSLGVLICWGCHGDAVKDAPAADRLPEFMLCVQVGFVGGSVAYLIAVPMILQLGPGPVFEYTIALLASVVVRAYPWPRVRA